MDNLTTRLKFMLLNAENLFLLSDQTITEDHLKIDEGRWQKLSTSIFDNKPLNKCFALAKIIQDENPDIIMLCEVGGLESLTNFNRLFLKNKYSPALSEGNSNRHIDVGFLIRKEIGFYFDLISNKNRPINFNYPHEMNLSTPAVSHKFSRDVAELHLFQKDRDNPFLLITLTHLKSHLDPENIDPRGSDRRQAELKAMIDIYLELEEKYSSKIPMIVAGDFNGNATSSNTDVEFTDIYNRTKLKDVCELTGLKDEDAYTFYQVGRSSKPEGKHLDYCFLNPLAQGKLTPGSTTVYRYKNPQGLPHDPPTSVDAKLQLPSDHYPIFFVMQDIEVY